jgi:multicomponent Na+:H+ antiporter subunit A
MFISILLIFIAAVISPVIIRPLKKVYGIILGIAIIPILIYFLSLIGKINQGDKIITSYTWFNYPNIEFSFLFDGLSLLFTIIIIGIGILIFIYSNAYMKHHEHLGRFYLYMLIFMGSMLGLVLAGNLISLYIFWELTSISSYLLISFYNKKATARKAALQAILVTEAGGLFLLASFILIGIAGEGFELSHLLNNSEVLRQSPFYSTFLILLFLGAFTKSAQVPFHFWLPLAMEAPTPVSAYLHSATMVKAGVYLLARLAPAMGNSALWHDTLIIVGGITMFTGAYLALTEKDLKSILAYSTINALGIMVLLIGIGNQAAIKAMLLYFVVHAFYKAALFMIAGNVGEKTGTRDIYLLGNLKKEMPLITILSVLVLLSMAGLPPLLGFVSKEFIYEAQMHGNYLSYGILTLNILSNAIMLCISAIIAYQVFFRKDSDFPPKPLPGSFFFWIGPATLGILGLLISFFPEYLERILEFSLSAVINQFADIDIELWHGFTNVFWFSMLTIAMGIILFIFRKNVLYLLYHFNSRFLLIDFSDVFSRLIDRMLRLATKQTSYLQHGYHRFYLSTIFIVSSILLIIAMINGRKPELFGNLTPFNPYSAGIGAIMIIGSIAATRTRSKLSAIITMGIVGYGLALIFMMHGATDLAIVQILVETFILVLFVMVSSRLPKFTVSGKRISRLRDGLIAALTGGVMAILVLLAFNTEPGQTVSQYYIQNSYPEAHGKNIVNVILVDFRALDTLGEITVLAISALGIVSLLKFKKK